MLNECDITDWVAQANSKDDSEFREAVHTILAAVGNDPNLQANMVVKGGILMAIRYHSHRFTKDIDMSSDQLLDDIDPVDIQQKLNQSLSLISETLDYGLDCRVQSCRVKPTSRTDRTFPSITMKVGYAYKGTTKHRRLLSSGSPTSISIDYSLNEPMPNVEKLYLDGGAQIFAYALVDLVAEKLRALLQQVHRRRMRRQDIFDLYLIFTECPAFDETEKRLILNSLLEKAHARGIEPTCYSFTDPEVKTRAKEEYHTLASEVDGELPDFEKAFELVEAFYRNLPW